MAVIQPDFYLTTHLRHCAGLSHARIPVRVPMTKTASRGARNAGGWPRNQLPLRREKEPFMKVTAPEALTVRPLPEICQAARRATCGECWQVPGKPCTPEGDHVA